MPSDAQLDRGHYINSWSARTGQRLAARTIDSMIALGWIALVLIIGPHGRPIAQDILVVGLIALFETALVARTGATAGMIVAGIRVAQLGRPGPPDRLSAWRRSVPVALCYAIFFPGTALTVVMPFALLISIGLSPLRRGFHDRLSDTVVVQVDAPRLITEATMSSWWDSNRAVVWSPWGRVPDLYDRRRARAHRTDGAWWLAASVMVATIVFVGVRDVPMLWLWSTAVWLVIVGIDETHSIAMRGATPGHEAAGYRVVDIATGLPPTPQRALVRAIVLTPLLYVPPLQLILGLWVHASALHRGPHDLAAHTVVVEPGFVAHTFAPKQNPLPPPPRPPLVVPGPF